MSLYSTNPLVDTRWDELVSRHPRASAFHHRGWLEALARTYGYEPIVFTSTPAGRPLSDGIVFCRVSSWMTGTRLVSLPFSDHCDPLLNDATEFPFVELARVECDRQRYRYLELRPLQQLHLGDELRESSDYCWHLLDLSPSLEKIFAGFNRDSIQRKIRRAEREGLSYEVGKSQQLADDFYRLVIVTRKRHHLLPQPRVWFRNLLQCMGDKIQIRLARKDGRPIAAILTLRQGACVIYKYGCSDEKLHRLGGVPFLFWKLVEESKAGGAETMDLGRSDWDQQGLMKFKDRLGATRTRLKYYRYPPSLLSGGAGWMDSRFIRGCIPILPQAFLSAAGGVLYRHLG